MMRAIEECPNTTELAIIDLAFQSQAPDMGEKTRDRLSGAIMLRVQELSSGEAA